MRSCTPQKQPPARTARSSFMDVLHLIQVVRITLGLHVVAMDEPQRGRVDAIAQSAAVPRPVGKHVAEMAVAVRRAYLGGRTVRQFVDMGRVDGPGEARPAGAGVELVRRGEQR